jgi:ABC-type polysaccharide/polyol phosphate export permease
MMHKRNFRQLCFLTLYLAGGDIRKRYASSLLGIFWIIGQPLLFSCAYILVFSIFMGDGLPGRQYRGAAFIPYYMIGFSLWTFLSDVLTRSVGLPVSNASLITKIKFPHVVLVPQCCISAVIPFLVILAVGIGSLAWKNGLHAPVQFWYPLLALLCVVLLTMGLGWMTAALSVFVPDWGQIITFFLTLGFFGTPILYPADMLETRSGILSFFVLKLNPMSIAVDMFRAPFFGIELVWTFDMTRLILISLFFAIFGLWVYKKLSRDFADFI